MKLRGGDVEYIILIGGERVRGGGGGSLTLLEGGKKAGGFLALI